MTLLPGEAANSYSLTYTSVGSLVLEFRTPPQLFTSYWRAPLTNQRRALYPATPRTL